MRHTYLFVLLTFVATSISTSCIKEKETQPMSCVLETANAVFTEASIEVTYTLEVSGDYQVASFYYYDETGKVIIENPTGHSSITVALTNQKLLKAGAEGSVKTGAMKVSYTAQTNTNLYTGSDQCVQTTQ
ncbi:MAG: hypothetical protein KKD74_10070 [Bacteroidetes bacterium]|nr:hypothetical protein [Bacteroidota bacterium]